MLNVHRQQNINQLFNHVPSTLQQIVHILLGTKGQYREYREKWATQAGKVCVSQ